MPKTTKTSIINVKKAELNKRGIKDFAEWNSKKNTLYIGRNMSFYVKGATKSKWYRRCWVYNPIPFFRYNFKSAICTSYLLIYDK